MEFKLTKANRIFPTWKKTKKGERPPGSYPPKKKSHAIKAIVSAMILFGLLVTPVQAGAVSGTASWYGPGNGVAMPFCTWTYRHTYGCGSVLITSLDTGLSVVAPVIDYCQCYVGTAQERIVDLQWGVVTALGLDISRGLYPVTVLIGVEPVLTDTSMRVLAPHWLP